MTRLPTHMLVTMAAILVLGCGSTVKASLDTSTGDGPGPDTAADSSLDTPPDGGPDTVHDPGPDGANPECSDGIDNDGDDLIDMDDWDCDHPTDSPEGPGPDGCTMDSHCAAGWEECDHDTGECYTPPNGGLCATCEDSSDCGDGVLGDDPDRDYCVHYGMGNWHCAKDCGGDFDCPRGFWCDFGDGYPPGFCRPVAISCNAMDLVGNECFGEYDCLGAMPCHDSICTYECETQHDCPDGTNCTSGWCYPG